MKVVLLPLDERPCNFSYPSLLPLQNDVELVVTPKEYLSKKKVPCNFNKMDSWLFENIKDADYLIISLDTFLYGGIIPSRLHHYSVDYLKERSNLIKKFKEINPNIKIFANELIMRCPGYSIATEEPDYFDECGLEICKCGIYLDKEKQGLLTEQDKIDQTENKKKVKDEYLNDLIERRAKNLEIIKYNLLLLKDGYIDFFSVPQDDCAPFGFSAMDRREVEKFIKENNITNEMGYPGADEVGLDLLSKVLNEYNNYTPKVYVHYVDVNGKFKIPEFEDRPLDTTIKLHLKVAGCEVCENAKDADIIYVVNCGNDFVATSDPLKSKTLENRDFGPTICLIKEAKASKKIVAIADSAYSNEGDRVFFNRLVSENLIDSIDSYAGWNTNSNTLGTTTAEAVAYFYSKNKEINNKFLFSRYLEDVFYMSYARRDLVSLINEYGLRIDNLGDKKDEYSSFVKNKILELTNENHLEKLFAFTDINIDFPWNRTFEIDLEVK